MTKLRPSSEVVSSERSAVSSLAAGAMHCAARALRSAVCVTRKASAVSRPPSRIHYSELIVQRFLLCVLLALCACKNGLTPESIRTTGYGSIQINSTPTGASVWLDGSDCGRSTECLLTDVPVGQHTVGLTLGDKLRYDTAVTVTRGGTSEVEALLLPAEYGYLTFADNALDVAIAGTHAYVATSGSGLQIVDVSNPSSPQAVGAWVTSNASGVAVEGQYVYMSDSVHLRVIDVSNPASPYLKGSYRTGLWWAEGVAVSDSYAYVANGWSGLRVVDVSNPAEPYEVGFCDTPDYAWNVAVSGNYAYVADGDSGLMIVDVGQPSAPHLVGRLSTGSGVCGVTVEGSYAFLAATSSALVVVDVSNAAVPQAVAWAGPSGAQGVSLSGSTAYVVDGTGLAVLDVSALQSVVGLAYLSMPGTATAVTAVGGYAYVAARSGGVRIIKVAR